MCFYMRNVITKAAIGIKTADLLDVLTNVLCFSYFDTTSSIDLTCASVRQIFIQSEFDCNDVPSIIEYAKNVPIVFVGDDETQCVS